MNILIVCFIVKQSREGKAIYTKQEYRADLEGMHEHARTTMDEWRANGGRLVKVGNSKLGERGRYGAMLVVSGLAFHDCPGRTEACTKICYAEGFHFLMFLHQRKGHNHIYSYLVHNDLTRLKEWLIEDIQHYHDRYKIVRCPVIVRIHEAGDFVSADHVSVWAEIAVAMPDVTFYGYSHSYRVEGIVGALNEANTLPNFRVRESFDSDEVPDMRPGTPMAFVSGSVKGNSKTNRVDMIARAPYHKGAVRCPEQVTNGKVNCVDCGLCWNTEIPIQFFRH